MREHDTYRSERRNEWAAYHRLYRGIHGALSSWREFNTEVHGKVGFSVPERIYPTTIYRKRPRSKYMPHQGKQEMARRVRPSPTLGS